MSNGDEDFGMKVTAAQKALMDLGRATLERMQ